MKVKSMHTDDDHRWWWCLEGADGNDEEKDVGRLTCRSLSWICFCCWIKFFTSSYGTRCLILTMLKNWSNAVSSYVPPTHLKLLDAQDVSGPINEPHETFVHRAQWFHKLFEHMQPQVSLVWNYFILVCKDLVPFTFDFYIPWNNILESQTMKSCFLISQVYLSRCLINNICLLQPTFFPLRARCSKPWLIWSSWFSKSFQDTEQMHKCLR